MINTSRERERKHLTYIGIAYDEPKRITNNPLKKYPLYEWKITEKDALEYCYSKGYDWGGIYKNHKRVSCWICPLQRLEDWRILRKDFPDLWEYALKLDRLSPITLHPDYTLTDLAIRFKLEDEGIIKDARGWKDVVHDYIRENNIEVSAAERIFILDKIGGSIKKMLYKYKNGEFYDENDIKL